MTTTINADTVIGGAIVTGDASGVLALQAAGNTGLTLNSSRAIGVGASPSYGTSGQALISAGSSAAPTWSNIAGTITATASGSITANAPVAVNSDGTVSSVTESPSATPTIGTANTLAVGAGNLPLKSAYSSSAGKFVVVDSRYAYVGTVSGTTTTFSAGVQYISSSVTETAFDIAYVPSVDRIVVFFNHPSGYPAIAIGTISGSTISFGSAIAISVSSASDYNKMAVGIDGKIGLTWLDASSYTQFALIQISTSALIASSGETLIDNTGACYWPLPIYDATANKYAVLFRTASTAYYKVITYSGTTPTIGARNAVGASGSWQYVCNTPVPSAGNNIIGSGGYATYVTISPSAATISFDSNVMMASGGVMATLYYDNYSGNLVAAAALTSSYPNIIYAAVSAKTIGSRTTTVLESTGMFQAPFYGACQASTDNKLALTYPGSTATSRTYIGYFKQTNLTAENYIGMAAGAYTNGQTATIQTVGSVNSSQTSLTPAQTYYVQPNGTLSQSAAIPSVVAGTALTSTSLIVKG